MLQKIHLKIESCIKKYERLQTFYAKSLAIKTMLDQYDSAVMDLSNKSTHILTRLAEKDELSDGDIQELKIAINRMIQYNEIIKKYEKKADHIINFLKRKRVHIERIIKFVNFLRRISIYIITLKRYF